MCGGLFEPIMFSTERRTRINGSEGFIRVLAEIALAADLRQM